MINQDTKFSKTLSICIPTFNRPEKIYNLLNLILPQIKNSNIEIIITDNSSNEETQKKLEPVLRHNCNVSYFKNNENIGFAKNLKKAISYSNGSYIWMLGDDDIPNPESIEKILNAIEVKKNGWIFFNFKKSGSKASKNFYDKSVESTGSNLNSFIHNFGVWTSFMSASIINSSIKNNLDSVKENNYFAFSLALLAGRKNGCSFINFPLITRETDDIAQHRFNNVDTYLFDFFEPIDDLIVRGDISKKTRNSLAKEFFYGIIPLYLCKIKLNKHLAPPLQLVYEKHKGSLSFYTNILPIYFMHPFFIRASLTLLKWSNYIFQIKKIERITNFLLR